MGRTKRIVTSFIFLFLVYQIAAQNTILGVVKDSLNNPIAASLVLKDSTSSAYLGYTYAKQNGAYKINTNSKGKFKLVISSLGFKTKIIPVIIDQSKSSILINITLVENTIGLDEVFIKAEKSIFIQKDTVRFKTKAFIDGTEQSVEDLLKKIPGLNIDDEGRIKIGNQEIEKLMVDGDDFFEKGYRVLSKNMPAHPVEEVELLKQFSENKLLKGIENSNKVALNLKLKDKAKRIWFGDLNLGYGLFSENRYKSKINLMNFGKKNKYFFLGSFNNIGINDTEAIYSFINSNSAESPGSFGDDIKLDSDLNLKGFTPFFSNNKTNFNNSELVSINGIFNLNNKLKLKTNTFFNWDETLFYRNNIDNVNVGDVNFTNTQNYTLNTKSNLIFGKTSLNYTVNNNSFLVSETKLKWERNNIVADLEFNNATTIQNLKNKNNFINQKLNYTYKLPNTNKVLLLTARFINEKLPQKYKADNVVFTDLFIEDAEVDNLAQNSQIQMLFGGVNAHLFSKSNKNNNLLEIQLGNSFQEDKFDSQLSLYNNSTIVLQPDLFSNRLTYKVNNLYVKNKYNLSLENLNFTGKLNFHLISNSMHGNLDKNQQFLYANPTLKISWDITKKNKLTAYYSYNTTNANLLEVYNNYMLTNFQTFTKGTGDFNQLASERTSIDYSSENWNSRVFFNFNASFVKNHDFFSTNNTLTQNYILSEKILIKNRSFLSLNSRLDYYFKFMKSNLKLGFTYGKSQYKNSVNNNQLRNVTSNDYIYKIGLRSGFKSFFNYHIGSKWNLFTIKTNEKSSFKNQISFLDLSFIFNKKIDLQLQSEHYFFGDLKQRNSYLFLDINLNYKLLSDKLILGITANNLFNTKQFENFSVSDVGSSKTIYRLQPRFAVFSLNYKF